ncbi:MarR family winged helix-turn-helix transcriptional regulator [Curtobacterium sp. ISL-83]|uniref:MarR family winged helix-turn-helix transcriptional regulator n=1 Tax=Curtobacterium sp. ISL-83 TaxID=2819145 RepID=UPI001BE9201E|nr:MarR family transcriptional regulator [Curtobacterium sp. ISL-83]MBT2502254.1 MarR family transcriptional regulator [Curtobacterium sp. ISL-83]
MQKVEPDGQDAARLSTFLERFVPLLRSMNADRGISPSAASLLTLLEVGGGARVTELARTQSVSQPAMTQLVRRLHAEGLVSRAEDDRTRATVIEISPAGRRVLEQRRTRREQGIDAMLDGLGPAERAAVTEALPALERLLTLGQRAPEHPQTDGGTP